MFVFGLVANTIKKKRKKTVLVKYGDFNIVEDNFNMVKKKHWEKSCECPELVLLADYDGVL